MKNGRKESAERRTSTCKGSEVGKNPTASERRSVWLRPWGPWRGRWGSGSYSGGEAFEAEKDRVLTYLVPCGA